MAVNVGSPCSGPKGVRAAGIRNAVSGVKNRGDKPLSLLSIDMGIRNLAFAHFTAPKAADASALYAQPTLQTWRRVAIAQSSNGTPQKSPRDGGENADGGENEVISLATTGTKESFEPADYARHAYDLVRDMLQTHEPNHVIIERQRFRSGGRAAVPEWTIRVGVFEGMLYAVLRTLIEHGMLEVEVEPVQPTQVNRYWLEGGDAPPVPAAGKKLTGREVKRAKIDLVGGMLDGPSEKISISEDIRPFAREFVSTWKREGRTKRDEVKSITKLDDLADSLLQGLAWIDWQNHRRRIDVLGSKAVELDSGRMV